ncbi:hypothetical protein QVD17_29376 [Tagetes erecta]|uniref:Uncharacterized protein n=1 Tax=Tagetes erecta TaxID=13708 RepID=A0AAD8KBP1_TARER|nr:hypothetical protein QVD17_29376 [Tagetes erecta]
MYGKTNVTKGYPPYTNIPAQRGGYDTSYAVENKTKTLERVRDFVGSPSKVELLKEYVHSPSVSPKFPPKNHYEDYEPKKYGLDYENSSEPVGSNKHLFASPTRGYASEGSNKIGSGFGLAGSRIVKNGNFSGLNKSGQTVGPTTRHPLTTSSNIINEGLGLLEESVYFSPRADPRRRGVLDDLSTRAQPLEPQKRYALPAFVAKANETRQNFTKTRSPIDSHDAARSYRGSFMP